MKKIYSLILLLCVVLGASAASKTKLYVNPGHGGYGDNDRETPMPAVNGVKLPVGSNGYNKGNCFWESSGNTYRALGVQYFWTKYINSNIKLSRSENNEAGDLSLSSISSASGSYGGYFMSLHTNAGNASANYMLVMYSATSKSNPSGERVAGSKAMSTASAKWQDAVILTNETYTTARAMTDRSFYGGSGLGVLNTNSAPGYLAESWFHDYRPEAFRMCSKEYNYFLAWQIVRAYLESPGGVGGTAVIRPIIVGDIRDLSKSCGYSSYTTRGRDKYLALNGVKVTLLNVGTGGTKSFTTDDFNNGFYAFYDLHYGATYQVTVEKDGYKTQSKTVTVGSTDTQHLLSFDMVEGTNSGITVSPASLDFGEVTAETSTSKTLSVTGTDLSSAISVSSSNTTDFAISTTSLAKTGGSLTVTYKPTAAGNHSTTITLTSGTHKKTVVVSGSAKNPPLTFTEGWNFSETTGKKAAWMSDYTSFRNMTFGAGKLYVVNNSSEILILKAQTGEKLGSLNMSGVEGGTLKVIDVKYIDGKVAACNLATTATGEQVLKVYVWDNDNAAPRVLLETTNIGGTERLGDTFNYSGDLTNGTLFFAEGKASTDTRVVTYKVTNGVASTTPTVTLVTEDGSTGVQFGLSPRVIPEADGKFWCVGQNYYPTLFDAKAELMATVNAEALKNEVAGNTFRAFSFKGTSYALATTYEPNSTAAERLRKGRVVLLDGTDGWAEASNIGEYPSAGLGTTRNTSMSSGVEVAVNGTSGVEMWVLVHNQGIAYYKNGTVPTYSYANPTDPIINVSASVLNLTGYVGGENGTGIMTVTGENLTEDIKVTLSGSSNFKVNKTVASKTGETVLVVTYTPSSVGSHTATITLSSAGAPSVKVTLNGTGKANLNDYVQAMKEGWNYGGNTTQPSWLNITSSGTTRFIAENDGKLYVLNCSPWGTPEINIIDAYTGNDTGSDVNIEGVSGGLTQISSMRFVNGTLVAANAVNANHTFTVYAWKNGVSSAPVKILEDATHGGLVMGSNISISGDLTNGYIWATDDGVKNVLRYTISNGTVNATPSVIALTKDGSAMALAGSRGAGEVIPNEDGTFWVDGQDYYPILFSASGVYKSEMNASALNNNNRGTALKFFNYGDKKYAAGVAYLDGLKNGFFTLCNVTNGIDLTTGYNCKYPANGLGGDTNAQNISSICQSISDDGYRLNIWVCCALQGVAYYYYDGRVTSGVENIAVNEVSKMTVECNGSTLKVKGVDADNVTLHSVSGALVAKANSNVVNVEGLNGIYIVTATDAAGVAYTAKVVIR
jgi:hypothetical protein